MLIDTHVHLDAAEFDADRDAVIARAVDAGVTRGVLVGVDTGNFDAIKRLSAVWPGSVHAYGIHPLYVLGAGERELRVVRERLAEGDAVAVGEIGLDGFVDNIDMAVQENVFVEQLKLAREFDLPVILHVRRAQDRVLKYLRQYRPRGGIAHAFNGSRQQADIFMNLGFALGFGGTMTYSGSTRIRDLAASLPLENIVLESDAPDIPPSWNAHGRNEPENVRRFAQVLAELREIDVQLVMESTTRTACRVLSLSEN